jgi:hypothetical protein
MHQFILHTWGIREVGVHRPSTLLAFASSAPCRITATTFKAALTETVRGGSRFTATTFKAGMRVRRSSGGAHPEADRAAAPRWGSSPLRVIDP